MRFKIRKKTPQHGKTKTHRDATKYDRKNPDLRCNINDLGIPI
jgi:hypothetical protein